MKDLVYRHCCVDLSPRKPGEVEALLSFVETARPISLATFRRRTNAESRRSLLGKLGYAQGSEQGIHIQKDYHVGYLSGTYRGKPAVALMHSAIEYMFCPA